MAARKRRHRKRRPGRSRARREPRRRLLIVCEGEKTEPTYLRGFERWARNNTVDIEVVSAGGNPKTLVEEAERRYRKAEQDAARQGDSFLAYDEVWCVFDRDRHAHYRAAIQMARTWGIGVAVSNPCFELWLLLHLRESPGKRSCGAVTQLLKKETPGYTKGVRFEYFQEGYDLAVERSQGLRHSARGVTEPYGNPSTSVDLLTESIRGDHRQT